MFKEKALVLDFGGVISKTLFETHAQTEAALRLPSGVLQWRGPFDPETDVLWQNMQAGIISEREYYLQRTRDIGDMLGVKWNRMEDFLRAARGENPMEIIRPEALDAINRVKSAGFKLAILSNELDLFYGADFRTKLNFLDNFELIIDATYTKILKPDPRAYHFVTDGLKLPAENCIFVDDQKRNIDGAEAIGMKTILFDVANPVEGYNNALAALRVNNT